MNALVKEISKPAFYLLGFALTGTLILAGIHALTEDRILENERLALLKQISVLIDQGSFDNDPLQDQVTLNDAALNSTGTGSVTVYRARQQGEPVAAVYAISSPHGYSGSIRLVVGVRADQTLAGVRVVAHKETPGLGDRIEASKSDWVLGFSGKSLQNPTLTAWAVRKDGGEFDQFTGATITPRAIVGTVKDVLIWSQQHQNRLFQLPTDPLSEDKSRGQ